MQHIGDITGKDGGGINGFCIAVTKYRFGGA